MQMTDYDIAANYRQAKDQKAQIGILADLNLVREEEMEEKLEELGLLDRTAKRRYVRLDQDKAMALWLEGASDAAIAKELGVVQDTVRNWRRRRGLRSGARAEPSPTPETAQPRPAGNFRLEKSGAAEPVDEALTVAAFKSVLARFLPSAFNDASLRINGAAVRDVDGFRVGSDRNRAGGGSDGEVRRCCGS